MDEICNFYNVILDLCVISNNSFSINALWVKLNQKMKITQKRFLDLLKNSVKDGYLKYNQGKIHVPSKIELAIKAYEMGARDDLFKYLKWQDFELMCRKILEINDFECKSNFRFKTERKRGRYEIDIISYKMPYLLSIDCKKWWMRNKISPLKKAALDQIHRTKIFSERIIKKEIIPFKGLSNKIYIFPLLITSLKEDLKSFNIPIIPFSNLNSFLVNIDKIQFQDFYCFELYL
ncbi:MAG: hypothetical protein ACTSQO_01620 [Candidatus Helarchaeota archaeon]